MEWFGVPLGRGARPSGGHVPIRLSPRLLGDPGGSRTPYRWTQPKSTYRVRPTLEI